MLKNKYGFYYFENKNFLVNAFPQNDKFKYFCVVSDKQTHNIIAQEFLIINDIDNAQLFLLSDNYNGNTVILTDLNDATFLYNNLIECAKNKKINYDYDLFDIFNDCFIF